MEDLIKVLSKTPKTFSKCTYICTNPAFVLRKYLSTSRKEPSVSLKNCSNLQGICLILNIIFDVIFQDVYHSCTETLTVPHSQASH